MHSKDSTPASHKNTGLKRLVKALSYSFDGIVSALKHEAAFRQEVVVAVILIPVSLWMRVSLVEHLLLVMSLLLVMVVELVNSAIEAVVDDVSMQNRPLAKRAKDMGSAAVFLAIVSCSICWLSIIVANWGQWFA